MILEMLFSYIILESKNLFLKDQTIIYFLGIAIALSFCLVLTFENLFDRYKLVVIKKSFKKSFNAKIVIIKIIIIFAPSLK